jgi:hypothetical protein
VFVARQGFSSRRKASNKSVSRRSRWYPLASIARRDV